MDKKIIALTIVSTVLCLPLFIFAESSTLKSDKIIEREIVSPIKPDRFPIRKPQYERIKESWSKISTNSSFLSSNAILKGLEEGVSKEEMVANWMRYGHLFAYDPSISGLLFTKKFRKNISTNIGERSTPEDIFTQLYTLFKIYYHIDLKYSKNDHSAFEATKVAYGRMIIEQGKERCFDEGLGARLIWKLEDQAWRLDSMKIETEKIF